MKDSDQQHPHLYSDHGTISSQQARAHATYELQHCPLPVHRRGGATLKEDRIAVS